MSHFRTYQPTLGRYLTPDPIGIAGGLDLYVYAGQNPINYQDPMGLYSLGEFWGDAQQVAYVIFPLSYVADQIGAAIAPYLPEGLRKGTWFGTGFGEEAVDYWASRYNETGSPLAWTAGVFASLWTEDTWFGTARTLACASSSPSSVTGGVNPVAQSPSLFWKGTHSVYVGLDEFGVIRYVGSTGRLPKIRFAEHLRKHGTGRDVLEYSVIRRGTGLTEMQAHILEQRLINKYGFGIKGGQLLNRRNVIDPKYWQQLGIR